MGDPLKIGNPKSGGHVKVTSKYIIVGEKQFVLRITYIILLTEGCVPHCTILGKPLKKREEEKKKKRR